MIDFSVPLQGLERAETRLNTAATRIAGIGGSPEGDIVDLSAEAVALIEARNSFAQNVAVIKTFDQISKTLIDVLG
jgi:flagellar hook protein FlgE